MTIKLKDNVEFASLKPFGFIEDPANCEMGDTYYHLNNYFLEVGDDFRVTVSTISRHIDILCLAKEKGLHNMYDVKPLYEFFSSGLIETVEDNIGV